VNWSIVKGKRIVIIDDSIVRGTTDEVIVTMLWKAGAKEIHLRISCPRIKYSCFYGVDTPDRTKLLANQYRSVEKMRKHLGVTSLGFLPLTELQEALGKTTRGHCGLCSACFTGDYPI
jgi:amidophosphoribosyltransferase